MSESTPPPDSTRTLFELQRLSAEVEELNILLNDSNTIIRSLFQLLRDHNIHVDSTELIKAREKVEAEIQTLRTANAGLVEKVAELQSWKDQQLWVETEWSPNELAGLLGAGLGESQRVVIQREVPKLVEKVASLETENERLQAGGCARDQRTTQFCAEAVALADKVKRLEAAGDEMAAWLRNPRNLGDDPFMADQWEATKGQP